MKTVLVYPVCSWIKMHCNLLCEQKREWERHLFSWRNCCLCCVFLFYVWYVVSLSSTLFFLGLLKKVFFCDILASLCLYYSHEASQIYW